MEKMDFIFLYIKIYHLYQKKDLEFDHIFRIAFESIKQDVKDFMLKLDNNKDLLDKYNYSQCYIDSYKKLPSSDFILCAVTFKKELKKKFGNNYFESVRQYGSSYSGLVISYDDLLNKYKEWGYVSDKEYITLKNNYGYVNYLDCNCDNELSINSPKNVNNFKMLISDIDKQDYENNSSNLKDLHTDTKPIKKHIMVSDYDNELSISSPKSVNNTKLSTSDTNDQDCENNLSNSKSLCIDIKPMKKYIMVNKSSIDSSDIQDIKQDIQTTINNMINSCNDKEKLYELMNLIVKIFKQ